MSFDLPGVEPGSDIEKLFKAVGFVVIQWGFAEQSLDLIVVAIFHGFEKNLSLNRRPQNLRPKVDFLRKCFTKFPELEQFRTESDALLDRFIVAGEKRNDLVHGAITTISPENDAFMFLKIDVKPKEHHQIRSVFFDDSDWPAFRKELLRLSKDGRSLAQRVWNSLKTRA